MSPPPLTALVGARKHTFEQLPLHRHKARTPVEAASLCVALFDDDLEHARPLRDRIALRVGEQRCLIPRRSWPAATNSCSITIAPPSSWRKAAYPAGRPFS